MMIDFNSCTHVVPGVPPGHSHGVLWCKTFEVWKAELVSCGEQVLEK